MLDYLSSGLFSEVSSESRWLHLIGLLIENVEVWWEHASVDQSTPQCPQSIQLHFEDGQRVLMSAAIWREDTQTFFGMADSVIVAFDQRTIGQLHPKM